MTEICGDMLRTLFNRHIQCCLIVCFTVPQKKNHITILACIRLIETENGNPYYRLECTDSTNALYTVLNSSSNHLMYKNSVFADTKITL
jgi:hypothetical protein